MQVGCKVSIALSCLSVSDGWFVFDSQYAVNNEGGFLSVPGCSIDGCCDGRRHGFWWSWHICRVILQEGIRAGECLFREYREGLLVFFMRGRR